MSYFKEEKIVKNADITPKHDLVFKRIFGTKGNEGILKDFLESILEVKIDSLELDLATELLPDFYDGKKSRVDVRTKLSDGTEVNIEIQMYASGYSEKRCLQYWSKIYSNNLKEGGKYTDLKKTICIWILNEDVYKTIEDFQSKFEIVNRKYLDLKCFDAFEIYIIELQKLRNFDIIKPNKKKFWLWFIDHTNRELVNMACNENKKIAEARKQLDKIRADEELMERIRLQEAYEIDERTELAEAEALGFEKGELSGIAKSKEVIAKNLLKLKMSLEDVSKATGLSTEEIEKLKQELKE